MRCPCGLKTQVKILDDLVLPLKSGQVVLDGFPRVASLIPVFFVSRKKLRTSHLMTEWLVAAPPPTAVIRILDLLLYLCYFLMTLDIS